MHVMFNFPNTQHEGVTCAATRTWSLTGLSSIIGMHNQADITNTMKSNPRFRYGGLTLPPSRPSVGPFLFCFSSQSFLLLFHKKIAVEFPVRDNLTCVCSAWYEICTTLHLTDVVLFRRPQLPMQPLNYSKVHFNYLIFNSKENA